MAMVYFLSQQDNELYSYDVEPLDGDWQSVQPIDMSKDGGVRIKASCYYQGRRIDGELLPSSFKLSGPKRDLVEVQKHFGAFWVPQNFKEIVEKLEPGVHQFFPIELVWSDGGHAAHRYWFNICNRLDSVDRERTTVEFRNTWYLKGDKSKMLVFNRSQIGSCHVWIDKFIAGNKPFVSEAFKKEMEMAGVTGLHFRRLPEVD